MTGRRARGAPFTSAVGLIGESGGGRREDAWEASHLPRFAQRTACWWRRAGGAPGGGDLPRAADRPLCSAGVRERGGCSREIWPPTDKHQDGEEGRTHAGRGGGGGENAAAGQGQMAG